VLKRVASGDESYDEMVPPQVAKLIRQRGFFGYRKNGINGVSPHFLQFGKSDLPLLAGAAI
jgi:hypothetical protein